MSAMPAAGESAVDTPGKKTSGPTRVSGRRFMMVSRRCRVVEADFMAGSRDVVPAYSGFLPCLPLNCPYMGILAQIPGSSRKNSSIREAESPPLSWNDKQPPHRVIRPPEQGSPAGTRTSLPDDVCDAHSRSTSGHDGQASQRKNFSKNTKYILPGIGVGGGLPKPAQAGTRTAHRNLAKHTPGDEVDFV